MESMFTGGCSAYQVIVLVQVMPYFNQFIPSANVMLDLTSQIFALTAQGTRYALCINGVHTLLQYRGCYAAMH